jgi:hypothetical protein
MTGGEQVLWGKSAKATQKKILCGTGTSAYSSKNQALIKKKGTKRLVAGYQNVRKKCLPEVYSVIIILKQKKTAQQKYCLHNRRHCRIIFNRNQGAPVEVVLVPVLVVLLLGLLRRRGNHLILFQGMVRRPCACAIAK